MTCAVALALAYAFAPGRASAQEPLDPLISPLEGGDGSRFQIVGQFGWTPGETVTLGLGFTTSPEPLAFDGPFPFQREVTVLADGTWSFPITVTDEALAPLTPGPEPGYIVVRAESPSKTGVNAFIFTVDGARPLRAEVLAALGFGPAGRTSFVLATALFAAGTGAMLIMSGALRRQTLAAG
jgi:hypothetical protein